MTIFWTWTVTKYLKQLDESIAAAPRVEPNDIAGCFIEMTLD